MYNTSVSIYNFSGIYDHQSFYRKIQGSSLYDMRDIQGTNCMCAFDTVNKISAEIKNLRRRGYINFIDSGNYHYMSYIMTSGIKEDFDLILFDNHPDMQESNYPGILSCGGWVRSMINDNPHLKNVYMVGVKNDLIIEENVTSFPQVAVFREIPKKFGDMNTYIVMDPAPEKEPEPIVDIPKHEFLERFLRGAAPAVVEADFKTFEFPTINPVYISIDKDVLSTDEVLTNWDQGNMSVDTLFMNLKRIFKNRRVLGIDICGDAMPDMYGSEFQRAVNMNNLLNYNIWLHLRSILWYNKVQT